jgi:predicted acetyltransferase
VRSPDGRGASACTIWFDGVNGVGLFEPVGTHPDFQGKGLGKAVMAEGLRRMKAAGMTRAIVGFDPNNVAALALYTAMGFSASCYFVMAQRVGIAVKERSFTTDKKFCTRILRILRIKTDFIRKIRKIRVQNLLCL